MRVFDSIDEVKEYLSERAETHLARGKRAGELKGSFTRKNSTGYRTNDTAELVNYRIAGAYRDALDALNEIRPGAWDALQRMKSGS